MSDEEFAPVTPGEMLKDEFLAEYRLSQSRLKAVGISPNPYAEIVNNWRRISADTALMLGLYFGTSAEFWMNLQSRYDLKMGAPALDAGRGGSDQGAVGGVVARAARDARPR